MVKQHFAVYSQWMFYLQTYFIGLHTGVGGSYKNLEDKWLSSRKSSRNPTLNNNYPSLGNCVECVHTFLISHTHSCKSGFIILPQRGGNWTERSETPSRGLPAVECMIHGLKALTNWPGLETSLLLFCHTTLLKRQMLRFTGALLLGLGFPVV